MAEVDRFTASREKAAASIRSKVAGFNFEDQAEANIKTAELMGKVASVISKKTTEQNRNFDKLLKLLNFLPNDVLEQKKQKKELFVYMARLTASIEKQAKAETNPVKKLDLMKQARDLRKQGRTFASDYDPSQPQNLKEKLVKKVFRINPEEYRAGGGVLGAYSDKLDKASGFNKLKELVTGKKDDAFERQVKQESMFPELSKKLKDAVFKSRYEGGVRNTDETGMETKKRRSSGYEGAEPRGVHGMLGGVSVLRKISDDVVAIREAITGKGNKRTPDNTFTPEPPKSLFSKEEQDYNNPANWGIKKSGKQKGRKFWNKRNSKGHLMKPGEVEPEIPDTPSDIMERMKALEPQTDTPKIETNTPQPKLNTKGELEVVIDADAPESHKRFESSGTEKEDAPKVDGSMTKSNEEGIGIGGLILGAGAFLTELLPAIIGVALPLILTGGTIALIYGLVKGLLPHLPDSTQQAAGMPITGPRVPESHADEGLVNPFRTFMPITGESVQNTNHTNMALEETENRAGVNTWKGLLEKNAAGGSFASKALLNKLNQDHPLKSNSGINMGAPRSGDMLEKKSQSDTSTVVAPIVNNNITNNNGGGGGETRSAEPSMPDTRTSNPSFKRREDQSQNRTFKGY